MRPFCRFNPLAQPMAHSYVPPVFPFMALAAYGALSASGKVHMV
jgi:hypothetical protein